ncbi:DeoR/GlpR family DNA-binding transcription regulator [Scatolibacter rhodanostii]|uniref:DeoR/GlpR family DNA-binding transcription regulator n=1 Tax=Scatolibacter rhodanostii TaxID=2014781 RepID=UPI000C070175|nr:DeoR/GlpR family DNA-binding transcription regulator [Scatolibacter rhodanostii]
MIENRRHKDILELIERKKYMKPAELSRLLYVSISTIRRDLIELEKLGVIQKSHGQVSLFEKNEPAHMIRASANFKEKAYIAKIASSYIENGQSIFLDSSTTVNALCAHIGDFRNMTVITNSLQNALDMVSSNNKIIVTGGDLKPNSVSLIGEKAEDFLESFNVDYAFVSCKSVNTEGIYEEDYQQGHLKGKMIRRALKKVLLCDNGKLGKMGFYCFASLYDVDIIIFNQKPDNRFIEACTKYNCEVVW